MPPISDKALEEIRKIEDRRKKVVAEKIYDLLRATNQFYDLLSMNYVRNDEEEVVVVKWTNDREGKINVHMDSGWAMILDVIQHLDETKKYHGR